MAKCGPAALRLLAFKKEAGKIMYGEVRANPTGPSNHKDEPELEELEAFGKANVAPALER